MKKPNGPKKMTVNFPPNAQAPKPKIPDLALFIHSPEKVMRFTVPAQDMIKLAQLFQAFLNSNGIRCTLEEVNNEKD